jgi:hypothetical protein
MLRAEKCALPFFFQTYPAQTMVRLIHGQQKPSWVPTGHCATRKKVLCERAAATHAAPASIPRPLDAVRVRRKPVGRCDRHGRLRATTRSSLWRAIFFSSPTGRNSVRMMVLGSCGSRDHHSPGWLSQRILASGLDGSKWRGLVHACSASLQAAQPSHAESKETSHEICSPSGCRCTAAGTSNARKRRIIPRRDNGG